MLRPQGLSTNIFGYVIGSSSFDAISNPGLAPWARSTMQKRIPHHQMSIGAKKSPYLF
jgi:hypothetical protein